MVEMSCNRCGKASTLYFAMVDNFDLPPKGFYHKWCPACVWHLMAANKRYLEGEFKGDQDTHQR